MNVFKKNIIKKRKKLVFVPGAIAVVAISALVFFTMDMQIVSAATTNLSSDFSANELIVEADGLYYTNGYEVDIGNKGIQIYGIMDTLDDDETDETFINSGEEFDVYLGASFIPDQSTITMDDSGGGPNSFITAGTAPVYNLIINTGAAVNTEVQDPLVVENDLTITVGEIDVVSGEDNQIQVDGDWTNNDTFEARSGTVVLGGTGPVNLDSGCATASSCACQTFFNFT